MSNAQSTAASTAVWQPLGPTAVMTPNYGLVTGRISSIAIDPADVTGNHVYIGTTGGGVWSSQNAASSGNVVFTPLTDSGSVFDSLRYGSISIGAVTVQPGGTGVVLAGTGDPNDALDSYYGSGLLRSTDGGHTWTATTFTTDYQYSFLGEGFAGFAWSTVNPQLVVAAVAQSYEGTLVSAPFQNKSYAGLYYSTDAGATWSLARITDGPGKDVQGPLLAFAQPYGNSATAVVWNPVRRLFIAAVRFHGYYQSSDAVTWTRMATQPGSALTSQMCPTNLGSTGSIACPIFRGVLAVNPSSGDTFAWTVDRTTRTRACGKTPAQLRAELAPTTLLHLRSRGARLHSTAIRFWDQLPSPTVITIWCSPLSLRLRTPSSLPVQTICGDAASLWVAHGVTQPMLTPARALT